MRSEPGAGKGTGVIADSARDVLDITVLMGGPSSERRVSLMSGAAIADGLERAGHEITRADIGPRNLAALDRDGIDVVFIALHGEFGESGQVQGLCESRGLRYTGSGVRASELGMDKAGSKQLFKQAGLRTPDWMIVEESHRREVRRNRLSEFTPPVVLKPVDGGSSVDITIAHDAGQRDKALDELLDTYGRAMIERYVPGRELTVGILGDEALPLLEIVPAGEFYDLHAKYDDDAGTRYVFDHGLSDEVVRRVRADALAAHRAIGCRDVSRVDFILDSRGGPQVLEINTIPGFTSHSLLPMAAERAGISFDELVDRIARLTVER